MKKIICLVLVIVGFGFAEKPKKEGVYFVWHDEWPNIVELVFGKWTGPFEMAYIDKNGNIHKNVSFAVIISDEEEELVDIQIRNNNELYIKPLRYLDYVTQTFKIKASIIPSGGESDLSGVFVYPSPWKKKSGLTITFKKLTPQATIKIFNVVGEEVANISHTDGTDEEILVVPDKLSSGVYIYLIESPGVKNKIGKIGIIK